MTCLYLLTRDPAGFGVSTFINQKVCCVCDQHSSLIIPFQLVIK